MLARVNRVGAGVRVSVLLLALGWAGCSSESESAGSCGNIAACYATTVALDPASPAECRGWPLQSQNIDLSDAPASDGSFTNSATPQCRASRNGCVLVVDCDMQDGNKTRASWTFSATGFTGNQTVTHAGGPTCTVSWSGARLAACGSDAGTDAAPPPLPDGTSCTNSAQCSSACCVTFSDGRRQCGSATLNTDGSTSPPGAIGCSCTDDLDCSSSTPGARSKRCGGGSSSGGPGVCLCTGDDWCPIG